MQIEVVAIVLSIVSTIVAFVDTYMNQYRRGRISMPPLRVFRLEPLNFHADGESYRAVRLTAAMTFVNTGALSRVVDNLRIRLRVPGADGDVLLDWRNECDSIEAAHQESRFATQPSLSPYGSLSKIYGFVSRFKPADGKKISTLEQYGEDNPERAVEAVVEMLENDKWSVVRKFNLHYRGANAIESDFDRINMGV